MKNVVDGQVARQLRTFRFLCLLWRCLAVRFLVATLGYELAFRVQSPHLRASRLRKIPVLLGEHIDAMLADRDVLRCRRHYVIRQLALHYVEEHLLGAEALVSVRERIRR